MSQQAETENKKKEKVAVAHIMVMIAPKGGAPREFHTICGWKFDATMTVEFLQFPYGFDGEIRPCKDCQGKIDNFSTWRVKA